MHELPAITQGWLSSDDFRHVVSHTPLVSMDFVVTNPQGEWLLGERLNRPAQGSWFVPGGRILKGETLDATALRLTQDELGQSVPLSSMCSLGVYQHFYTDSMLDPEVSTHYVVLAYHLSLDIDLATLPRVQHGGYQWWPPGAIAQDNRVHANTRAYLSAITL